MKDAFLMACFAVLCAMTGWAGHWSYSVVEREGIRREIREDASATDKWAKDCERWFHEANRDLKHFDERLRDQASEIQQLQNVVSGLVLPEHTDPEACK